MKRELTTPYDRERLIAGLLEQQKAPSAGVFGDMFADAGIRRTLKNAGNTRQKIDEVLERHNRYTPTAGMDTMWRARYLMKSASRDVPDKTERRYFTQHVQADYNRLFAKMRLDAAKNSYGPVVGWYAKNDGRVTPECRFMNGKNFDPDEPPEIGYPGAGVHNGCRCVPGPPHKNGDLVGKDTVMPTTHEHSNTPRKVLSAAKPNGRVIELMWNPKQLRWPLGHRHGGEFKPAGPGSAVKSRLKKVDKKNKDEHRRRSLIDKIKHARVQERNSKAAYRYNKNARLKAAGKNMRYLSPAERKGALKQAYKDLRDAPINAHSAGQAKKREIAENPLASISDKKLNGMIERMPETSKIRHQLQFEADRRAGPIKPTKPTTAKRPGGRTGVPGQIAADRSRSIGSGKGSPWGSAPKRPEPAPPKAKKKNNVTSKRDPAIDKWEAERADRERAKAERVAEMDKMLAEAKARGDRLRADAERQRETDAKIGKYFGSTNHGEPKPDVGTKLDTGDLPPRLQDNSAIAFNAIDKVMSDGPLPRIKVKVMGPGRPTSEYGAYTSAGLDPKNDMIELNPAAPFPALTAVHEAGHFIDMRGFGFNDRKFSSHELDPKKTKNHEVQKTMDELQLALEESSSIRRATKLQRVDPAYHKYFTSPHEMFARAFAQYIAMKSKDRQMLAQLKEDLRNRGDGLAVGQWPLAEFERDIMPSMDHLFGTLGWLK